MRKLCKEDTAEAEALLKNLDGSWRLIFTTGTKETQKKWGRKVSYFPLKATQSFNTATMEITNGGWDVGLGWRAWAGEDEHRRCCCSGDSNSNGKPETRNPKP